MQFQSNQDAADDVKGYLDLFGMSTEADLSTISTLKKANIDLRKELEAVQAKVPTNPNLPKYLGIGACLVSCYFAIQQESAQDLATWKKGAIVATSGLLGAVPYLNFVTIATMPYLVNKGVELRVTKTSKQVQEQEWLKLVKVRGESLQV